MSLFECSPCLTLRRSFLFLAIVFTFASVGFAAEPAVAEPVPMDPSWLGAQFGGIVNEASTPSFILCSNSQVVTSNANSGAGTLRQAVIDACSGGIITFDNGISFITLTTGQITIDKHLAIHGPGADLLTISGNNSSRIFVINPSVVASLSGLTIANGRASSASPIGAWGGGMFIWNGASVQITNSRITNNLVTNSGQASGGGLFSQFATLTVTDTTVSDNTASSSGGNSFGGGMSGVGGSTTLTNSRISGNSATSPFQPTGGGISSQGANLTVTGTTVSGNTTTGSTIFSLGGGIRSHTTTLKLTNSTISGNSAVGGVNLTLGGGISVAGGSMASANNTISGNSVSGDIASGGGIANEGVTNIINTIVAGNSATGAAAQGPDVFLAFNSLGHNLIGKTDGSTGFTQPTDLTGTIALPLDAQLGPLANNGGPTQTLALLPAGPAVNGGDDCVLTDGCAGINLGFNLTTDQRGIGRPRLGTVDIGAFEIVFINTTLSVADLPDPTVVGQSYTVTATLNPPAAVAATGTIAVSDGQGATCTMILPVNTCTLVGTSPGLRNVIATYSGDAGFSASAGGASHLVNKANTTTTITNVGPEPSALGQPYSVAFTTLINAPGAGSLTGTVTVSDGGGMSCTAQVTAGSCQLTSNSAGLKLLRATYNGNANFNASTSAGVFHLVNPAPPPAGAGFDGDIDRASTAASPAGTPGPGDGVIDLRDLFWYDRFARLLSCPDDTTFNEFQRLDGNDNGFIDGGDQTYIFNIFLGLQPKLAAKGSTQRPAGLCTPPGAGKIGTDDESDLRADSDGAATAGPRTMIAVSSEGQAGRDVFVPIEIESQGDELLTSTTVAFDPNVLSIDPTSGYDANPDVMRGRGGTKTQIIGVNAGNAANGQISIVVDFSAGTGAPLTRGTRQIVILRFHIREGIEPGTTTSVVLTDTLVPQQTIDRKGTLIDTQYRDATVTVRAMGEVKTQTRTISWFRSAPYGGLGLALIMPRGV